MCWEFSLSEPNPILPLLTQQCQNGSCCILGGQGQDGTDAEVCISKGILAAWRGLLRHLLANLLVQVTPQNQGQEVGKDQWLHCYQTCPITGPFQQPPTVLFHLPPSWSILLLQCMTLMLQAYLLPSAKHASCWWLVHLSRIAPGAPTILSWVLCKERMNFKSF